jgi:glycine oxidase
MSASDAGPRPAGAADVTVVGAGVIGLAVALALADDGRAVWLISEPRPGASSAAAAGMLAPSVEEPPAGGTSEPAHRFAVAARDRFVSYLADLGERSGIPVPLNRLGILEVALDESEGEALRARRGLGDGEEQATRGRAGEWLEASALAALEPGLRQLHGALLHANDGAVDNVALLRALETAIECTPLITRVQDAVREVSLDRPDSARVTTIAGEAYDSAHIVLAAGAWTPQIRGLPRPLPIEPVRGQMFDVVVDGAAGAERLRHVVYGPRAYLVPRGQRLLVGATMEHVGFDARTTEAAMADLHAGARELWPPMARAQAASRWAGLRPATPDLLPIIGLDPDYPALVYACGHSRSGILMAPLSADCVAALITGARLPADLAAFGVDRFAATPAVRPA